ncbi:MAG: glutaredoxin 3 [Patiriisocius sp.]|jgi:glutaredoxin 3
MSHPIVRMYTTRFCPFCVRAKSLLNHKDVQFEEIAVDSDPEKRREMMEKAGQHTVPQIWIGENHVGGCDELFMLERNGKLDELLTQERP